MGCRSSKHTSASLNKPTRTEGGSKKSGKSTTQKPTAQGSSSNKGKESTARRCCSAPRSAPLDTSAWKHPCVFSTHEPTGYQPSKNTGPPRGEPTRTEESHPVRTNKVSKSTTQKPTAQGSSSKKGKESANRKSTVQGSSNKKGKESEIQKPTTQGSAAPAPMILAPEAPELDAFELPAIPGAFPTEEPDSPTSSIVQQGQQQPKLYVRHLLKLSSSTNAEQERKRRTNEWIESVE